MQRFSMERFLKEPFIDHSSKSPEPLLETGPQGHILESTSDFKPQSNPLLGQNSEVTGEKRESNFDTSHYHDFILKSWSYKWFVQSLLREAKTTRGTSNMLESVRKSIISELPAAKEVTRKYPSQAFKVTFEVAWDPLAFIQDQKFNVSPQTAVKRAITLIGEDGAAQALTTEEYVAQTWPATGSYTMSLISEMMVDEGKYTADCKY
jgi:hypothetical protein